MIRGRRVRFNARLDWDEVSGNMRSMFTKDTASEEKARFAMRKRVQVFPERGYETTKVSSEYTAKLRSAMSVPSRYFKTLLIPYIIEKEAPSRAVSGYRL